MAAPVTYSMVELWRWCERWGREKERKERGDERRGGGGGLNERRCREREERRRTRVGEDKIGEKEDNKGQGEKNR